MTEEFDKQLQSAGSALDFAQTQFDDAMTTTCRTAAENSSVLRKTVLFAKILKGASLFGGLVLTYGVNSFVSHVIGGAIALASALDLFTSNFNKMMVRDEAEEGFDLLTTSVRHSHTDAMTELLEIKESDPPKYAAGLTRALTALRKRLQEGTADIIKAIRASDREALRALKIENKSK